MLGIHSLNRNSSRGFTLIEMSIVLVIIGLIIGGILKGQEIIESSRQKNIITQIDAVRSAVNTFADKYQALPGDYRLAQTRVLAGLNDGDSDGIIGAATGVATLANLNSVTGAADENPHFFNHLAAAELLSGTTIGGATNTFNDTSAFPATAIPGTGMTMAYGPHIPPANTNAARTSHWLRIHKNAGGNVTQDATGGAFTGKSLFQIDLKIDDGSAGNGSTRSAGVTSADCSTAYDALGNTQECVGYFELLK
ncbi:MAG: prepilin-type N-terminal cleavage/methylation domain-containing protein [Rhodospirillaceae bacterium]